MTEPEVQYTVVDGKIASAEEADVQYLDLDGEHPIRISFEETYGEPGLDIRTMWWPPKGDAPAHTKRGVRIPHDLLPHFMASLLHVVLDGNHEDLYAIRDAMAAMDWKSTVLKWELLFGLDQMTWK